MRFRFGLLAAVIFLSVFLLSCAKDKSDSYNIKEEYEPEKITESKTADLLFIARGDYGAPGNAGQVEKMLDLLNGEISDEFNMDISVDWVRERNYLEDISARIASGTPPDAIEVYFPHDTFFSLAASGELLDIGEMFAELMPGTYDECRRNFPDVLDIMKYDGKSYILPTLKANPVRHCIVTTKTLYDEYGEEIKTLADYEEYMQWISTYYPDLIPGYGNMYYIYDAYLAGAGYSMAMFTIYVEIEDRGMNAVPVEELKEFREVYDMLARWSENKYFGDISYPTFQTAANYGQLASFFINTRDTNFRKDIMMMPTDREYEYIVLYPDTKVVMQNPQNGMVFTKTGDAAERIMKFIEWMYEDRQCYDIFHYGLEGENYNLKNGKLFLNMNQNIKAVADWWGSASISSYHMDRPIWSEPEGYQEFLEKVSFTNTISQKQVFENAGIDYSLVYQTKDGSDSLVDLVTGAEPMMEERRTVFTQFMRRITQGDFTLSADEVIEKLRDANGWELADAFNNAIKYLKND